MDERTRDVFASHGLRCTKQRAEIYSVLRGTTRHPTAEELHRMVGGPGEEAMSLATVYNTLEALRGAGLCRRIPTSAGFRYDADTDCHLHVSLPDGRLLDVPHELSRRIIQSIPPAFLDELSDRLGLNITHLGIQAYADEACGPEADGA